jgi:hypothetical protein
VSLRTNPIEQTVATPDGRELRVRVGVAPDPYIAERERNTVDLEVFEGDRPLAALNTLLGPRDHSGALALARDVVAGLRDGMLQPTAGALDELLSRRR